MGHTWIAALLTALLAIELQGAPEPDPQTYQRRHHTKEEKIEETYSSDPHQTPTHASYIQPSSSLSSGSYGSGAFNTHYSGTSDMSRYSQQHDIFNDQFNNFKKHFNQPQGSYYSSSYYSSHGPSSTFQDHSNLQNVGSLQSRQEHKTASSYQEYKTGFKNNEELRTVTGSQPSDKTGQKFMKLIYSSQQNPSTIVNRGDNPFQSSEAIEKSIISTSSSGSSPSSFNHGRVPVTHPEHGINILENKGSEYSRQYSSHLSHEGSYTTSKHNGGWTIDEPIHQSRSPTQVKYTNENAGYQRTLTEEKPVEIVKQSPTPIISSHYQEEKLVSKQHGTIPKITETNPTGSSWVSGSYTFHQVQPVVSTKQIESASLKHYSSFDNNPLIETGKIAEPDNQEYVPGFDTDTSTGSKKKTVSKSTEYHEVRVKTGEHAGSKGEITGVPQDGINVGLPFDRKPSSQYQKIALDNPNNFEDIENPNYNIPHSRKTVSEYHHELEVHSSNKHNSDDTNKEITPIYNTQFNKLLGSIESLKREHAHEPEQGNPLKTTFISDTDSLQYIPEREDNDKPKHSINSFDIRSQTQEGKTVVVNKGQEPVSGQEIHIPEPNPNLPSQEEFNEDSTAELHKNQKKTKGSTVTIRKETHNKTEVFESKYHDFDGDDDEDDDDDARRPAGLEHVPEKLRNQPRKSSSLTYQQDYMKSQFGPEKNLERLEKVSSTPYYNEGSFVRSTLRKSDTSTNSYPNDGTAFENVRTGGEHKVYWTSTDQGGSFEQLKAKQEFELKQKLEEMKEKMMAEMKRKIETGELSGGQIYVMHGGEGNGGIEEYNEQYVQQPSSHGITKHEYRKEESSTSSTSRNQGYPSHDVAFGDTNTGGDHKVYWTSTNQEGSFEQLKAKQQLELKQRLEEMKEKMMAEMKRKIETGEMSGGQIYVMHGGEGNGGIEEFNQQYVQQPGMQGSTQHEYTKEESSSSSSTKNQGYPFYADPDCEYSRSAGLADMHQMNRNKHSSKMTTHSVTTQQESTFGSTKFEHPHFEDEKKHRVQRDVYNQYYDNFGQQQSNDDQIYGEDQQSITEDKLDNFDGYDEFSQPLSNILNEGGQQSVTDEESTNFGQISNHDPFGQQTTDIFDDGQKYLSDQQRTIDPEFTDNPSKNFEYSSSQNKDLFNQKETSEFTFNHKQDSQNENFDNVFASIQNKEESKPKTSEFEPEQEMTVINGLTAQEINVLLHYIEEKIDSEIAEVTRELQEKGQNNDKQTGNNNQRTGFEFNDDNVFEHIKEHTDKELDAEIAIELHKMKLKHLKDDKFSNEKPDSRYTFAKELQEKSLAQIPYAGFVNYAQQKVHSNQNVHEFGQMENLDLTDKEPQYSADKLTQQYASNNKFGEDSDFRFGQDEHFGQQESVEFAPKVEHEYQINEFGQQETGLHFEDSEFHFGNSQQNTHDFGQQQSTGFDFDKEPEFVFSSEKEQKNKGDDGIIEDEIPKKKSYLLGQKDEKSLHSSSDEKEKLDNFKQEAEENTIARQSATPQDTQNNSEKYKEVVRTLNMHLDNLDDEIASSEYQELKSKDSEDRIINEKKKDEPQNINHNENSIQDDSVEKDTKEEERPSIWGRLHNKVNKMYTKTKDKLKYIVDNVNNKFN